MKVALACNGCEVAPHFGRCEGYEVAEIVEGEIIEREKVANPGHEPGALPKMLNNLGVECIIAGGMGPRAQQFFAQTPGLDGVQGVEVRPILIGQPLGKIAWGRLSTDGSNPCHHVEEE